MHADLLDLEVQLLVLKHGRQRIVRSLAGISEVSEADIERQLSAACSAKSAKERTSPPTITELVERAEITSSSKRERVATLLREFEQKRFLPERRLVDRFCFEHGSKVAAKSRTAALPTVLKILTTLSDDDLDELLDSVRNGGGSSGFAQLAAAIMDRPTKAG
ncbi:MAG: hypothetical protein EXS35_18200 [Pedosphaera sp.]|nr:hypothetical protein [Pedosphaera sp.]